MTMYLRRRSVFSAGDTGALSGTPGGHDYGCELSVAGTIDPVTGMVVNITEIDHVIKSQVTALLDGKLLDRDVPEFRDTPPTPLNIARLIWVRCADSIARLGSAHPQSDGSGQGGCRLSAVTLWWMASAYVTIVAADAEGDPPMVNVTRIYEFSASHRLNAPDLSAVDNADLFGKCNWINGHGHNYEVEVTLAGEPDVRSGRLTALDALDRIVDEEILTPFDHRHLNMDVPEFSALNPTSENLTRVIWDRLYARRQSLGESVRLHRVAVRETARNYFEYFGPETGSVPVP